MEHILTPDQKTAVEILMEHRRQELETYKATERAVVATVQSFARGAGLPKGAYRLEWRDGEQLVIVVENPEV